MNKQTLREDLNKAVLSKDILKTSVLRLLLSAINYYEIQKGGAGYEATEEDLLSVISKEIKQRKDSIEQFRIAKRQELVDKETEELKILQSYLPEQLGEEEITKLVKEAILKTGAKNIQDMGKVMGVLMPEVKGKADGTLVSNIVKQSLTS